MGIVARTAYWVGWWRRFGPPSGNEPKLTDPLGRYVIVTFVKGTNMGPVLRTETTINDTWDFRIGKRLHNLPALAGIGFTAN
jgi:hypothetical protein